jgi:hypothetical protein
MISFLRTFFIQMQSILEEKKIFFFKCSLSDTNRKKFEKIHENFSEKNLEIQLKLLKKKKKFLLEFPFWNIQSRKTMLIWSSIIDRLNFSISLNWKTNQFSFLLFGQKTKQVFLLFRWKNPFNKFDLIEMNKSHRQNSFDQFQSFNFWRKHGQKSRFEKFSAENIPVSTSSIDFLNR